MNQHGLGAAPVILLVIHQAQHRMTGRVHLDAAPDLTCEDGTLRHGVDGCGSTSNPPVTAVYHRDWDVGGGGHWSVACADHWCRR